MPASEAVKDGVVMVRPVMVVVVSARVFSKVKAMAAACIRWVDNKETGVLSAPVSLLSCLFSVYELFKSPSAHILL